MPQTDRPPPRPSPDARPAGLRASGLRTAGPGASGGTVVAAILLLGLLGGCRGTPEVGTPVPPGAVPGTEEGERAAVDAPAGPGRADSIPEAGIATRDAAGRRGLDVRHYDLRIDLRRMAEGFLRGHATLRIRLEAGSWEVPLDLAGLVVDSVLVDGTPVGWERAGALLTVGSRTSLAGEHAVEVHYHGEPRDGLVFRDDARGRPTAFADNWPNRARWWFPANDHPSDKATVRFRVRVPRGMEVVANGVLREAEAGEGAGDDARWTWETVRPIPTYTMVVGVADFARTDLGEAACGASPAAPGECTEVTAWTLAGDSAYAAERFRRAPDMVDRYAGAVAPFPYEKLAHVESSTRFGGMENASAIFYAMAPWTARRMGEGIIAHETAHQWFGDSVTPRSWYHLWLSEGFASYFDPLYFRDRDGEEAFRRRMDAAREEILSSAAVERPVVDSGTVDLYSLLDANAYEKGAWVLHMLRGLVGDSTFFRGIRTYYREHRHGTALTGELREAMEEASGRELGWFFEQWLYRPGYPRVEGEWWREGPELVVAVRQIQRGEWPTFRIPTELLVALETGEEKRVPAELRSRTDTLRVPVSGPVGAVTLDPDDFVLMVGEVVPRKAAGGGTGSPEGAGAGG